MQLHKDEPEIRYGFQAGTEHLVVNEKLPPRVGLYGGSFDPVHAGHIAFALQAQKIASLEHVFFVPERQPKDNSEAEHHTHRSVMVERALRPYEQFSLLDLPDKHLTLKSLPRLKKALPAGAELSLLVGAADFLWHKDDLPKLYEQVNLIVAVVSNDQLAEALERLTASGMHFRSMLFVDIGAEHISSENIRKALRANRKVRGLLPSVWRYARHQWLYIPLNNHHSS